MIVFEKSKAFVHGLCEMVQNPFLLTQQEEKIEDLKECLMFNKDYYEELIQDTRIELEDNKKLVSCTQNILQQKLDSLIENALPHLSTEEIYQIMEPVDTRQIYLYYAAKEILSVDPSVFFNAEDDLGYFEDAHGARLLNYVEAAKFGEIAWKELDGQCGYVVMDSYELNTNTPEYQEYRQRLYPLAIQNIKNNLHQILDDRGGMDVVFDAMDALNSALREAGGQDFNQRGAFIQQPNSQTRESVPEQMGGNPQKSDWEFEM